MPAPTRVRPTRDTFPQRWGYGVAAGLIVLGVILGIVVAATGLKSLYDDVNALRRNINNGEMLVSAERGDYVIYDEDGIDIGPFDVRVIRDSDDAVIPTIPITNGVDYDVDGNDGKARASVRLPTDDLYRIDIETSASSVVKFAFGGDVGAGPTSYILRGVVIGGITSILGVLLLFWTLVQHARWRLRSEISSSLDTGRARVRNAAANDAPATTQGRTQATSVVDRASSAAERGIGRIREELDKVAGPTTGGLPDPPSATGVDTPAPPAPPAPAGSADWRANIAARANEMLSTAEEKLAESKADATDFIATGDTTEATEAADTALARVQARIDSGESLRSIARDESKLARENAAELRAKADAQAAEARRAAADLSAAAAERAAGAADFARAEAGAAGSELREVGESFGDQLFEQAVQATELIEPIAEGLGDEAAVAGVAAAAAGAAVVTSRFDAMAPAPTTASEPDDGWEDAIATWGSDEGGPAGAEPARGPRAVGDVIEVVDVVDVAAEAPIAEPQPVAEERAAPAAEVLASPPARASSERAPLAPFSISGPPVSRSILAPPPAAQNRGLAAPPTPSPITSAEDAPPPPPPPAPELADEEPADEPAASDEAGGAEVAEKPGGGAPASLKSSPPPRSGFSLAPPPSYGAIDTKPFSEK